MPIKRTVGPAIRSAICLAIRSAVWPSAIRPGWMFGHTFGRMAIGHTFARMAIGRTFGCMAIGHTFGRMAICRMAFGCMAIGRMDVWLM